MKRFAAGKSLLKGCIGWLVWMAPLQGATVPDLIVATPEEAEAFDEPAPYHFAGQSLTVHTSFATGRDAVLEGGGQVIVGEGTRFEISGVVSSARPVMGRPLEKHGAGTLVLTGENTYTSNTELREGVLEVAGSSALGSDLYNLRQRTGTVLRLEAGARVLNHVQVIPAAPVDVPLAGLEDEAHWDVPSGTATLASDVSANAPVRKTGEGSLRITDAIMGGSVLRIAEGALVVDGMVTVPLHIERGARLEGSRQIAGMRVHAGGVVAPGGRDSAATLSSLGDVIFESGSQYHVNAYPDGRADLLNIYGEAQLDGSVWAEAGAGEWLPDNRYRILSADGGLRDSEFEGVETNLAFLDPALEYDAGAVYLTLQRNDLDAGDVGETPDDKGVGDVIDPPQEPEVPQEPEEPPVTPKPPVKPDPPVQPDPPVTPDPPSEPNEPEDTNQPEDPPADPPPPFSPEDDEPGDSVADPDDTVPDAPDPGDDIPEHVADAPGPNPLQRAIVGMTKVQARSALRQLSGSWHASVRSFLMEDSRYVRNAVLASAPDARASMGGITTSPSTRSTHGARSWAQGYAATGKRGPNNGVSGDRHDSRGIVMGLDTPTGRHWRLGGVFAAQHARLERRDHPASARVHTVQTGLVAHGKWDSMRLTAGLLHAWHRVNSQRRVSAGSLMNVLGAAYNGRSWQAFVELAPRFSTVRKWTPYLRHAWMRLQLPAFQEAGGIAAHDVQASTTQMNASTLGARYRHDFEWGGHPIGLNADVGWRRVLGNRQVFSTQRFGAAQETSNSTPSRMFTSQGLPLARHALALDFGATVTPRRNLHLAARYSGLFGSAYRDHAVWTDLRWAF